MKAMAILLAFDTYRSSAEQTGKIYDANAKHFSFVFEGRPPAPKNGGATAL